MLAEELAQYLALGHELSGVEFKGPGKRTDQPLQAKVVRAALGMANRRGGGRVIVGIDESDGGLKATGLNTEQANSWRKYDDVKDLINAHADPPIDLEIEVAEYEGRWFAVITVHEFADVPILCRKFFSDKTNHDPRAKVILRDGACYVRPRRKHETVEVPTSVDMRDLLDLATEKAVARFVTQAQTARLPLLDRVDANTDRDAFTGERAMWNTEHLGEIRSRGYWQVTIRPERYREGRISSLPVLERLITNAAVELRGWDFPYVDSNGDFQRGVTWIGQETSKHDMEAWRLFLSGQFIDLFGFEDDWVDVFLPHLARQDWRPGQELSAEAVVLRFTEIFELTKHLALADAYQADRTLHIDVQLHNLRGRHLTLSDPRSAFRHTYTADIDTYPYERDWSREDVIATPWELARRAAAGVLHVFGWEPTDDLLRGWQERWLR